MAVAIESTGRAASCEGLGRRSGVPAVRDSRQTHAMDRRWIDRIITTVGWTQTERHSFDWAATEQQLGPRLPADYKELAEIFGPGMFGEWLGLFLPVDYEGRRLACGCLVEQASAERLHRADCRSRRGARLRSVFCVAVGIDAARVP